MINSVETDKSRRLDLHSRCNEAGDKITLVFTDTNNDPVDISGKDWEMPVKRTRTSTNNLFLLTEASGLTVTGAGDNQLEIDLSEANAEQDAGVFFVRLIDTSIGKTRLNGQWEFHDGLWDGVTTTEGITVNWGDTVVNISVQWGASGSSNLVGIGDHDASGNTFPDGVSYTFYKITVTGTLSGVDVYPGDVLIKMQTSPTADWNPLTGWKRI